MRWKSKTSHHLRRYFQNIGHIGNGVKPLRPICWRIGPQRGKSRQKWERGNPYSVFTKRNENTERLLQEKGKRSEEDEGEAPASAATITATAIALFLLFLFFSSSPLFPFPLPYLVWEGRRRRRPSSIFVSLSFISLCFLGQRKLFLLLGPFVCFFFF